MKSEASLAMARFHDHFNKSEFTLACDNEFWGKEPPLDCVSQLKAVRQRFGSFQKLQNVTFQAISEPRWIRIETVSIFEKGELTERFLARPGLGIVNYQTLATQNGQ